MISGHMFERCKFMKVIISERKQFLKTKTKTKKSLNYFSRNILVIIRVRKCQSCLTEPSKTKKISLRQKNIYLKL